MTMGLPLSTSIIRPKPYAAVEVTEKRGCLICSYDAALTARPLVSARFQRTRSVAVEQMLPPPKTTDMSSDLIGITCFDAESRMKPSGVGTRGVEPQTAVEARPRG